MHDFTPHPDAAKPELYRDLAEAASALIAGEADTVANMANIAALVWQFVPRLNWAGFYRVAEGELVLGPFIGKPACIRIGMGQGVCGTAAQSGAVQLVPDVHAFPGHIACDGLVIAVIDLDSPEPGRFDIEDADGIGRLADVIAASI